MHSIESTREPVPCLLDALETIQSVLDGADIAAVCVGGLPTDVMLDARTRINYSERIIDAPLDLKVSPYRTNGTLRDIDILCLSDDGEAVRQLADQALGTFMEGLVGSNSPELSFSGYETSVQSRAWAQVTSQVSIQNESIILSLGAIAEVINMELFEQQWRLRRGPLDTRVFHPILHAYNYRVRSIGGLRPKDQDKVSRLEARLREVLPEEEWELFGPIHKLETRIAEELSIGKAIKELDPRTLTMSLARLAIKYADRSSVVVRLTQSTDGKLGAMGRWLVHSSRPSFGSKLSPTPISSTEPT